MSRSALGVTSDILGLKVLVRDAMQSLRQGKELPSNKRQSLSEYFHRYIEASHVHRLMPNRISKAPGTLQNVAARVVRAEAEAGGNASTLLAAIDKFAASGSKIDERDLLVEYLSRVNVALERSRAGIPVSRYL
jgi:hypothetical protein